LPRRKSLSLAEELLTERHKDQADEKAEITRCPRRPGLSEDRTRLTADLDDFLSLFLSLPIQPAAVDFELIKEAAKIKGHHPLSYPDTFAVATALREDAAIITGDPQFKQVESLVAIEWL